MGRVVYTHHSDSVDDRPMEAWLSAEANLSCRCSAIVAQYSYLARRSTSLFNLNELEHLECFHSA
jgi:hypothetical protein